MARALALLPLVALLLPAAAATVVVTDPAGDASLPALDLRLVDADGGNRSLDDDGRHLMDLRLQVAGLAATDAAGYRVTWTAASFHDPGRATSERGVEFALLGGSATWRPLVREAQGWSAGRAAPAEVDLAAGTLTARGAMTGGGALPSLSAFSAQSFAGASLGPSVQPPGPSGPADTAAGPGPWAKSGTVRLAEVPAPGRPHDLPDPRGDAPEALDLLGVWVDRQAGGFEVTYEVARLDASTLAACAWWRASFHQSERVRHELSLSASQSLRLQDGVVELPFLRGRLEWSPPGGDRPVETPYASRLELDYGSPGRIRAILEGPAWNATTDPERLFVSASLDCDAEAPDGLVDVASDEVRAGSRGGPAFYASTGPLPIAIGGLAGLAAGAVALAMFVRRALRDA